jgi:hypothetical protein
MPALILQLSRSLFVGIQITLGLLILAFICLVFVVIFH